MLSRYSKNIPLLYGSRSRYIYEDGSFKNLSKKYVKPKTFKNALVQCYAGGNTMVINYSSLEIIKKFGYVDVKSHDWWLYIVITGVGGNVLFDINPSISYRQHIGNIVGSNRGLNASLKRVQGILNGEYKIWNALNTFYLNKNINYLSDENKKTLKAFKKIQEGGFFIRLYNFFKSGIYRQTKIQSFALFLAAILKKI